MTQSMRHYITLLDLFEASDAPLYHATSFAGAKSILRDGFIHSFGPEFICTTRDGRLLFKDQHVQFVINTAKVKTKYSIRPIDFHAGSSLTRRDSEERIMVRSLPLSMVQAVMLMPIHNRPPGITAVMHQQGDEIAAMTEKRGIPVIDRRAVRPD